MLTLSSPHSGLAGQSPSTLLEKCLHALLRCVHETVQKSELDADMQSAISVCGIMCKCLGQQAASPSIAVVMNALVGGGVDGKGSDDGDDVVGDADGGGDDNGKDEGISPPVVGEKGKQSPSSANPDGVLFQLKRFVNVTYKG